MQACLPGSLLAGIKLLFSQHPVHYFWAIAAWAAASLAIGTRNGEQDT